MMAGPRFALRDLLVAGSDLAPALADSLTAAAAVGTLGREIRELPGVARSVAMQKVSAAVTDLLGADAREMLLGGWRVHGEIRRAARETAADPTATRTVGLVGHEVTWTDRPTVDVYLDGVRLKTLSVELVATLTVDALHATVRGGRLVSVDVGDVAARVSVTVEGHSWRSPTTRVDLPGRISLGDGIVLAAERRPERMS